MVNHYQTPLCVCVCVCVKEIESCTIVVVRSQNRREKKCEECGNRLVVTSVLVVSFCVCIGVCIGILINFAGERKCEESRP